MSGSVQPSYYSQWRVEGCLDSRPVPHTPLPDMHTCSARGPPAAHLLTESAILPPVPVVGYKALSLHTLANGATPMQRRRLGLYH